MGHSSSGLVGCVEVSRVPVGPTAGSPLSVVVTVEGPPRVSLPAVPPALSRRHPALSADPTLHSAGHCCLVSYWCHRLAGCPCFRLHGSWRGGGCAHVGRGRAPLRCVWRPQTIPGCGFAEEALTGGVPFSSRHIRGAHGCQPSCVCWVSVRMLLFSSFHT